MAGRRWAEARRSARASLTDRQEIALPGVDDGTAVPAHSLAGLFLLASAVLAVLIALPHGPDFNDLAAGSAAVFGITAAAVLGVGGSRVPNWALHPILVVGTLAASTVLLTSRGPLVVAAASLYIAVTLYAFRFFARPVAVAYLAGMGLLLAVVLDRTVATGAVADWLLIMTTAATVGVVVDRVRAQLWRVAMADSLTDLPNRQCLDRTLGRLVTQHQVKGQALSVAMVDLDGFKELNDREGHAAGDSTLRAIADCWRADIRRQDLLARYGGDEFVVVLPGTTTEEAHDALGRLTPTLGIQMSVGVASLAEGDDPGTLLARADAAVYGIKMAKRRPSTMGRGG